MRIKLPKIKSTAKLSKKLKKLKGKASYNAPTILVTVGIVGGVVAAIKACHDTTKVQPIIGHHKDKVREIKENYEQGYYEIEDDDGTEVIEYTNSMHRKDLVATYVGTGLELAKLYWASATLGGVSIFCIITAHRINTKRYYAVTAALATTTKQFKEYRDRVIDRFGEEVDKQLFHGYRTEEIEVTEVDEKNKTKKHKESVNVLDEEVQTDFKRVFSASTSPMWQPGSWKYNELTVKSVEFELQQFCNRDGVVFADTMNKLLQLYSNNTKDGINIVGTYGDKEIGWTRDNLTGNADVDEKGRAVIHLNPVRVWVRKRAGNDDAVYDSDDIPVPDEDGSLPMNPLQWEKALLLDPNFEGPVRSIVFKNKRA